MAAFVFYNPLAAGGQILEDLEVLKFVLDEECVFCDMTKPETYGEALFSITSEDILILCGGDGTLNRFVNLTADLQRDHEIYYFPAGVSNNFARDFDRSYGCNPFPIIKHLRDLPRVTVGNRSECFLTGIVFRTNSKIRRTFTSNHRYNTPMEVCATVDGNSYHYEKVHFLAVMYGKHCCDGMIPDPSRKRTDGDLSCVVIHGCRKLRAGYLLAKLRKGRKIRSRHLQVHRGGDIAISFSGPVSLLTDGQEQDGIQAFAASAR